MAFTIRKVCANVAALFILCGAECVNAQVTVSGDYVFKEYKAEKTYQLVGSAELFGDEVDAVFTNRVNIFMPERLAGYDTEALRDTIMAHAVGLQEGDVTERIEAWVNDTELVFEPVKLIKPDANSSARVLFDELSAEIQSFTPKLLVYAIKDYWYLGGAHPCTTMHYINYYIPEQRVLTLNDFFKPGTEEAVFERIKEQLLEDYPDETFWMDGLPAAGNFKIENDKIVFCYGLYEAGPYVMGLVEVGVYPGKLRDCITPFAKQFFDLVF